MSLIKGQGADTLWLGMYQNAIHKQIPEYNPHGLEAWLEKQDKGLQEDGKECGRQIEKHIKVRILNKLEELYGETWENKVMKVKVDASSVWMTMKILTTKIGQIL